MKSLLIARHAHAVDAPGVQVRDQDRPLSPRGSADASRLGRWILDEGLIPDLVLSSTAVRATSTAARIGDALGKTDLVADDGLYLAGPDTWVERVRLLAPSLARVLLVGHNPGVERLVSMLTGLDKNFAPADLAEIALPLDRWEALGDGTRGELVRLWRSDPE